VDRQDAIGKRVPIPIALTVTLLNLIIVFEIEMEKKYFPNQRDETEKELGLM